VGGLRLSIKLLIGVAILENKFIGHQKKLQLSFCISAAYRKGLATTVRVIGKSPPERCETVVYFATPSSTHRFLPAVRCTVTQIDAELFALEPMISTWNEV
jgi:hypothetical protein